MIKIYETVITNANILRVAAGTTGYCGGDTGHGGKTFIEIEDLGGTDVQFKITNHEKSLSIELGGDSELDTIIEALEFITKTLKRQAGNK